MRDIIGERDEKEVETGETEAETEARQRRYIIVDRGEIEAETEARQRRYIIIDRGEI